MTKISNLILKASDLFQKCTLHLETNGFVKVIENEGCVEKFSFGPLGQLLSENLKKEWIHSNVRYRDHNVFLCAYDENRPQLLVNLKDTFKFAKDLCNGEAPFGLAGSTNITLENDDDKLNVLTPKQYTSLHSFTILAPQEAEQYYYRWQQQRKRWWRLFSADPSRFSFAEGEGEAAKDTECQETKILASFPWGDHCIEQIRYLGPNLFKNLDMSSQSLFSVRGNGKRGLPHVVECVVNLDLGVFTYMCDSFKEKKALKCECVFHRKLAPYKFGFAAGPVTSEKVSELLDLSKLFTLGLSKTGLSVLLPGTDLGKKSLTSQLTKHSSLGIPYTLVFREETLSNGIAGLYSMRTTLQEDVHVGNFEEYALKLMKNY